MGNGATNNKLTAPITQDAVDKVWALIKKQNISVVDLKFNDLPGLWQHFSIPVEELGSNAKEGGYDLIILGARPRPSVGGLNPLGTTVEYVLRNAPSRVWLFTGKEPSSS